MFVLSVPTFGKVTYSNASDGSPKKVVVGDVLRFLTGAPVIPPGGFGRNMRQVFTSELRYVSASTCARVKAAAALHLHLAVFKDDDGCHHF